ncbi:MAG TPA: F0F1 ATP synthase subunit B [Candidatus Sulfomarinibacteraceae bacterium]|nr:F0F1 ATP synthase subunit B [Candidatus Sulfomarinibacteraceae bacterium]
MEGLGINIGYLLIQILGIIVILAFMKAFAYEPILRVLEERQARIAKGLEDARQAAIARDNADAEAKKILDAARAEAAKSRQQAVEQAEETRKGIIKQAEAEAKEIVAEARSEAEEERNRILAELRGQVASIAIAATNKLVQESLDADRQRTLINSFLSEPPAGVSQLSGDQAVVTSALPLTDEEKQRIQQTLGIDNVEFKVEPGILGGLIIRVGDQVVDDSIARQMGNMRESLV